MPVSFSRGKIINRTCSGWQAALARAELRLVGLAPELGLAPQGPPLQAHRARQWPQVFDGSQCACLSLQADESRPWALQRLEVLQELCVACSDQIFCLVSNPAHCGRPKHLKLFAERLYPDKLCLIENYHSTERQ